MRQRRPYFDDALHDEIEPAAKIALHRARRDADHRRYPRQHEAEDNRDAEPINQPRRDIVQALVGAEPVPFQRAAAAAGLWRALRIARRLRVERFAALLGRQHPGRRRWRRQRRREIGGVVGEADRRPEHPTVRLDLRRDAGIAIIGRRLEAAELVLGIGEQHREQQLAFVGGDDRAVVGDEFGEQRDGEQREENAQRPQAALVATEIVEPAPVHRAQLQPRRPGDGLHAGVHLKPPASQNLCADRSMCR